MSSPTTQQQYLPHVLGIPYCVTNNTGNGVKCSCILRYYFDNDIDIGNNFKIVDAPYIPNSKSFTIKVNAAEFVKQFTALMSGYPDCKFTLPAFGETITLTSGSKLDFRFVEPASRVTTKQPPSYVSVVAAHKKELDERDATIQELIAKLAERDAAIQELSTVTETLRAKLAKRDAEMCELRAVAGPVAAGGSGGPPATDTSLVVEVSDLKTQLAVVLATRDADIKLSYLQGKTDAMTLYETRAYELNMQTIASGSSTPYLPELTQ
jgi:hypothetical protein